MSTQTPTPNILATDHLHSDLKRRSVRGGMVTVIAQGVCFVLTFAMTVITARLLSPADFGLVAMVTAITGLGQAFADLGLSEATVQRQNITQEQVNALFWINVAIGVGLMLVMAAMAPVLVWFYREPRLMNLTLVLSLTFLIGGLRVQHNALLQRQMRFAAIALRDVVGVTVAVAACIALAWFGAGYWAVAAYPLVFNTVAVAQTWMLVGWLPGPPRRDSDVRSLVKFGGNVAGSYLINYLNRNTDNVLIGWYWGASPLGLYTRAFNILSRPVNQLNAPLSQVMVPTLSRLQDEPERFARYYLRVANLVMWISTPLFAYLFVTARPVILLVLGKKWGEAAPVFQYLCIGSLAMMLYNPTIWLMVCRGQSGRMLKLLLILTPIFVASYAIGLPFGIKGVAFTGSVFFICIFPWVLHYAFRGTVLTLKSLGGAILCPVSVSLMGVVLGKCALHLVMSKGIILQLVAVGGGFAVAAGLSLLVPHVREEIARLKGLLSELRPRPA